MSRGSMVACRCGPGRYSDRNSGPAVRPAIRRGSRCAVSVPHVIHMVSPPLTVTRACLLDRSRSRSSTFRASTAPAREADSYSIRHKNFSKIAEPSRVAPCLPATSPSSSPTRVQRSINSSSSTTRATTSRLLHGQTAVKSHRHGEHRRAPTFAEHPIMIHSGHPADDPAEDHPRLRLVTASLPTGQRAGEAEHEEGGVPATGHHPGPAGSRQAGQDRPQVGPSVRKLSPAANGDDLQRDRRPGGRSGSFWGVPRTWVPACVHRDGGSSPPSGREGAGWSWRVWWTRTS